MKPTHYFDGHAAAFAAELDQRDCFLDRQVIWEAGPFRKRYYLGDDAYPQSLVTSARSIVFRGSKVVVVSDRIGACHIQPGGHIEDGETIEAAVRRELLEETGWRVGALFPFGFIFVEPAAQLQAAASPVSESIHALFVADGETYHRSLRDMTQIEVGSRLVSKSRALRELSTEQALLLAAAIQRLNDR